jgi:hypothetical protein
MVLEYDFCPNTLFFGGILKKKIGGRKEKRPMSMKWLDAKAELLQRIADAVTQAKEAGVKDTPGIILKALKAKARLEAFKGKHFTTKKKLIRGGARDELC